MRRLSIAAMALLALNSGCARKAPGPTLCRRFAAAALGVTTEGQARRPEVQRAMAELTTQCIVENYSRTTIACTLDTGQARACVARFEGLVGERR